jgi:glycosidase
MFAWKSLVLAAVLLLVSWTASASTVFEITDPRGDDHGDGNLLYPSQRFREGDLDLKSFKVENKGDKAVFTVEFHNRIREPERGAADELGNDFTRIARNGFYQFNIDIYIDTDRRLGSGHVRTLPGRLATIDPAAAWDVAVIATPRPAVMQRMLSGLLEEELRETVLDGKSAPGLDNARQMSATIDRRTLFPSSFKVRGSRISFEVSHDELGGVPRDTWGYTVFVTGANLEASLELMSGMGGRESLEHQLGALPISPGEWTDRMGGGRPGEALQPPIVDLFVPEGEKQEWILGDFDSSLSRRVMLPAVVPGRTAGRAEIGTAPTAGPWQLDRWQGQTSYEIFVRSFQDSDGDGIGDFNGLISRLDYLNDGNPETQTDLGIGALWLMPVFASPSYHGYDTIDYYRVNPQYGTEEDFDRLLAECHRRGIKVVLDYMMNHSSDQHPWFVESASGPDADKRDWYVWRDDDPGWTQPWGGTNPTWHRRGNQYYYGIFWGGMPDFNFANPEVMKEAQSIARFWLDRGVDGFRLDAARHLTATGPGDQQNDTPETHTSWQKFSEFMRREYPDRLMLGEIWADAAQIAPYYGDTQAVAGGDEFAMTFNFPLAGGAVQSVNLGDNGPLLAALTRMRTHYPAGILDGTFLTNHDMVRVASQLGNDPAKLRQAAAVLLTLPGNPWLYYGEEIGLRNGTATGDEDKRTPMPWTADDTGFTTGVPWYRFAPGRDTANVADQRDDPGSLLTRYRTLIHLRNGSAALSLGALYPVILEPPLRDVVAWERRRGSERLLVIHNLADEARTVTWVLEGAGNYQLVFGDPGVGLPAGGGLTLPARATGIWQVN